MGGLNDSQRIDPTLQSLAATINCLGRDSNWIGGNADVFTPNFINLCLLVQCGVLSDFIHWTRCCDRLAFTT